MSDLPTSDSRLVDQARAGDQAAFMALLRQEDAHMRALVFTTLNTDAAMDDVLQEAYIKAFRAIQNFRGDASFSTWLHRIVFNAAIDHTRRNQRHRHEDLDRIGEQPDPKSDVGHQVSQRDSLTVALNELTAEQRACVLLVDAEGYDYQSVADMLGVSYGTIASRLSRARATLRAALDLSGGVA